jgi:ABC-type lipoprotein export system ATPase subunit
LSQKEIGELVIPVGSRFPAVTIEHVSKAYAIGERRVDAVTDISFTVSRGEILALTGRSGSGKSTVLNIVGLLTNPDSGELALTDGHGAAYATANRTESELASLRGQLIGFIFQQFNLLPHLTAVQNVALAVPGAAKASAELAAEMLRRVGLADRMSHRPSALSGGEQQRVAVARALVNEPTIILADEPTGNLDQVSEGAVLDLLATAASDGCAVLIATHSAIVASRAERVLDMSDISRLPDSAPRGAPR